MLKTNCREVRNKLREWLTDCYNYLDFEDFVKKIRQFIRY